MSTEEIASVATETISLDGKVDKDQKNGPTDTNNDGQEAEPVVEKLEESVTEPEQQKQSEPEAPESATTLSNEVPEEESSSKSLDTVEVSATAAAPTPVAAPVAVAPAKKKRLTLQERLALAAAKGGKKQQKKPKDLSTESTPRNSVDISERPSSAEIDGSSDASTTNNNSKKDLSTGDILPPDIESLDKEALINALKAALDKYSDILKLFETQKTTLSLKESELKKKTAELAKLSQTTNQSVLAKKLAEKEEVIKDLMDEGSKLSMKELQLNTTIKKLKSKAIEDSELINDLQEKLDTTMEKLAGYEFKEVEMREFDTKREQLTTTLRELETLHNKLRNEHTKVSQQYKELKDKRFEQQLENTKNKLDEQTKKAKQLTLEVEELNIRLKLTKDQSKNEVAEVEEKLRKERERYRDLQEENANEIKRLENKMESWRMMNESSATLNDADGANESVKKLAASNELLQSQYTLAQENWKFIESSYLNKLLQLEQDINTLKQKDLGANKRIKLLSSELKAKNDELEEALDNESNLLQEIFELKEANAKKDAEIADLKAQVETLGKELEDAKIEFERKLEDELSKQRSELDRQAANRSFDGPIQQQQLYLNDLIPNPAFLKSRSVSNYSINDNIAFGESSTTPRSTQANSRKTSSSVINTLFFGLGGGPLRTPVNDNNARFFESPKPGESLFDESFNLTQDEDESYDNGYVDDYDNTRPNSPSSQHSSRYTLNKDTVGVASSTIGSLPGGVSNKNIQIIGKLSSQLRRLEVESLALKDEVLSLGRQKNELNNEIVKLLEQNSQVNSLKMEREELEKKLNVLEDKYQRTLEILGEKSERVQELTADVADLKELCKEQVQQLVELQTR